MKKLLSAVALATLTLSGYCADEKIPTTVQMAANQTKYKVLKSFPAKGGLTGWLLTQGPGKNVVLFTPADGSVVIAGNMLDETGKNLTKEYTDTYGPKIDWEKAWSDLDKSNSYVVEGSGSAKQPYIYVFIDPNCGYCNLAAKALAPYIAAGLNVRWIPVAFLSEDSPKKVAYLFGATDKNQAMVKVHASYGKKDSSVLGQVTPAVQQKIDANNDLMHSLGYGGTPALMYKNKAGKVVSLAGMFQVSQLPEITGMPAQEQTDPSVLRYGK